jgi:DNA uptake protein ComE-like DNA-binding protein
VSAALLLAAGPSSAAETKAGAAATAASASAKPGAAPASHTATKSQPKSQAKAPTKAPAKAPAETKLVDINSATLAELKTLPGVQDAEAAKIVAGRPYGSKAQLETRKILDSAAYEGLKQQVIARQPKAAGAAPLPTAGKTKP